MRFVIFFQNQYSVYLREQQQHVHRDNQGTRDGKRQSQRHTNIC